VAPDVAGLERLEDHAIAVDARAIEEEFARIWRATASVSEEGAAVRVRVMNLVAVGAREADAERFKEVMQLLPQRHPCRGVLAVAAAPHTALSATISAQCWRTGTAKRLVCSEEVMLSGGPAQERELASAVLALLVPDLPVALWLMDDPASFDGLATRLLDACDSTLVDSALAVSLKDGYGAIARVVEENATPCLDLAWARLAPWRSLIAQMFDGDAGARELDQVREIIISGGRTAPSSEAVLLAGWLASRLGFALADAAASEGAISAALYDGTRSVRMHIETGKSPIDAIMIRTSDAQFAVECHADSRHLHVREAWDSGATRRIVEQPASDEASLIALTLDGLGELATYRDALAMATALTGG
jgi:glucose-6-phosphate dehydrogenase assembly protein OpcA